MEYTIQFKDRVKRQWENKKITIDWLAYEQFMVDLLKSGFSSGFKVAMAKEALDAWTKRGYFNKNEYFSPKESL